MKTKEIWCIGNPLLKDDGAGPALFALLHGTLPGDVALVDCGTVPENYLSRLKRNPPSVLVIADTADMGLPGGSIRRMTLSQAGGVSFGTHGIPLSILLEPFLPFMDIIVIGIQPQTRGFGEGVSPRVHASLGLLADLLREGKWDSIDPYQEKRSPR